MHGPVRLWLHVANVRSADHPSTWLFLTDGKKF
jgi:hypothetical protein